MLKIYGTMLCPDCVDCCRDLDKAGVSYEFLDITDSILHLRDFLRLRDNDPIFAEVKERGSIGVPCIVDEKGNVSLSWCQYVAQG